MKKTPAHILIAPRITEKGAHLSALGAYVFNVAPDASKREVAQAVQDIFKVLPRKVALVRIPRKRVSTRGRRGARKSGITSGGKKAYVFLKKGDTIEIA